MADKAGVTGIGAAKVIGIGMAPFALPHLHGALAVPGEPIFTEHRRILACQHVDVTLFTQFALGELMTGITLLQRVRGVAEVHVVGLLLVRQPLHFLAGLHIVVDVVAFGLARPHHLTVTHGTVLRGGQRKE